MPSFEAGIMIILIAVSLFSISFITENKQVIPIKITGMVVEDVTGNMVKVTGMGTETTNTNVNTRINKVQGLMTSTQQWVSGDKIGADSQFEYTVEDNTLIGRTKSNRKNTEKWDITKGGVGGWVPYTTTGKDTSAKQQYTDLDGNTKTVSEGQNVDDKGWVHQGDTSKTNNIIGKTVTPGVTPSTSGGQTSTQTKYFADADGTIYRMDNVGKTGGSIGSSIKVGDAADGKKTVTTPGGEVTLPADEADEAVSLFKQGYSPTVLGTNLVMTKQDKDNKGKDTENTKITLNPNGETKKEVRQGSASGPLKSKTTTDTDGNTLTQSYTVKGGKSTPSGVTFQTSDGRTVKIENDDIVEAIDKGTIGASELYLAKEIEDSTDTGFLGLFSGYDRSSTDAGWSVDKDGNLKIGTTTITKAAKNSKLTTPSGQEIKEGSVIAITSSDTVYAKTENGFTYWTGSAVSTKEGVVSITPGKDYSVTQEFSKKTKIGDMTLTKGDYIRADYDDGENEDGGAIIYVNGKATGMIVDDQATKMEDFFDGDGDVKSNAPDYVKFKYEGFGGIAIRLKGAYETAKAGRALSNLLGMEDNSWRETMDNFFANTVLGTAISGKWEESICHSSIPKDEEGILYFRTPGGLVSMGAYVSAERTTSTYPNGTTIHLYKISYSIDNPQFAERGKSEDYKYNVYLYGDRTVKLWSKNIEIGEGDQVLKTGAESIVQYSYYNYNKICLKFNKKIRTASGDKKDETCSTITGYTGAATSYGLVTDDGTGTGTTTTGTTDGGEATLNQI